MRPSSSPVEPCRRLAHEHPLSRSRGSRGSRGTTRVALAVALAGSSLLALAPSPAHAEDMASVVARARDQVEKASYADALKTLAGLPDKGVPKALALEAGLLEANAALVVKGDAAAQAACAKAVVVADFDPDVGRDQSPKVRSACKAAAATERAARLARENVTIGDVVVDKPEVAWQPLRVSASVSSSPAWLRVVARLRSTALEGSFDLALAPSQDGPYRSTLDPSWARPSTTLTVELYAQDKFGDLTKVAEATKLTVPTSESMLVLGDLPAGAKVTVDGEVKAPSAGGRVEVKPGSHAVRLELTDGSSADARVETSRGAVTKLSLVPQKAETSRAPAWIVTGLGVAAGAAGAILLVTADSRRREIEEAAAKREPGSQLPLTEFADIRSKDDERRTFVGAGAGLLIGAGVAAVTATVLFAIPSGGGAKKAPPATGLRLAPVVGLGHAGLVGRF